MQHRSDWGDDDAAWIASYVDGDDYAALAEYFAGRGLQWKDGDAGFKSAR
jgi:putative transposase